MLWPGFSDVKQVTREEIKLAFETLIGESHRKVLRCSGFVESAIKERSLLERCRFEY